MPSPKDGTAGTPIIPDAPAEAKPAVNAVSGKVSTAQASPAKTSSGSYGSTKVAGASGGGGGAPPPPSPAAAVLLQAAKDGTPFCEQCAKGGG